VESDREHPIVQDGIFLGYDKNIPLENEGLGRLLAFLVSGWVRLPNYQLTIACPYWLVPDVKSLLSGAGIPPESYKILQTQEPWTSRLSGRLKKFVIAIRSAKDPLNKKVGSDPPSKTLDDGNNRLAVYADEWSFVPLRRVFSFDYRNAVSWRLCFWGLITLLIVGCLFALLLWGLRYIWHLLLALIVTFALYRLWRKFRKWQKGRSDVAAEDARRRQLRRKRRYSAELQRLIREINKQQQVQYWLVPTIFWPEANGISHRKSFVFPDLVLQEFPTRFADPGTKPTYARILETIQNADRFICYCRYTKESQLVRGVGVSSDQISVVGHARVELAEYLKLGKTVLDFPEQKEIALEILRRFQKVYLSCNPYWNRVPWDKRRYVVYPSQARGQKNIISLLRAIEILRHRETEPPHLVLTCTRIAGSDLDLFVSEHKLEPFVLFAPNVSNQVLAALYCWAALAVNPTLFEGGFPFTFTEAYSVGTPSILSDIPMVCERITDEVLRKRSLFNPLDPQELADKILWGIHNRTELVELQRSLFEGFPTWTTIARQYSDSLRS
jgi:glycosyltransferase involved in cell wall biosynthesis